MLMAWSVRAARVRCSVGLARTSQIRTDRSEGGALSPGMALEIAEDRSKPLGFVMQADRMFQQLFSLISHEIDERIGRK